MKAGWGHNLLAGKTMKTQKSKIQQEETDFGETCELSFGPTGVKYPRVIGYRWPASSRGQRPSPWRGGQGPDSDVRRENCIHRGGLREKEGAEERTLGCPWMGVQWRERENHQRQG